MRQDDPAGRDQEHRRQHRHADLRHQRRLWQFWHDRRDRRRRADLDCRRSSRRRPKSFVTALRETTCRTRFPGVTFSFLPADITSQILNFGLPAPIDLQVIGRKEAGESRLCGGDLQAASSASPASPTLRIQQVFDYPTLNVNVDRSFANQIGLTEQNVTTNLQVTLAGSLQTNAVLLAQPEERRVLSDCHPDPAILDGLAERPQRAAGRRQRTGRCRWAASRRTVRAAAPGVVSHYNVQPCDRHLRDDA